MSEVILALLDFSKTVTLEEMGLIFGDDKALSMWSDYCKKLENVVKFYESLNAADRLTFEEYINNK